MRTTTRVTALAFGLAATAMLAGCSGGSDSSAKAPSSLVIDTAFTLETGDPGRNYVPTGYMVSKAVYETLLDFEGADESTPIPGLATFEQNEDATVFTFTLEEGRVFSDGSPITADDVVFSLNRVKGMVDSKANFLMNGVEVAKIDDRTVKLTTATPSLKLPALMTNPSLAILNSKLVLANGGTTDNTDAAEEFLNAGSAGSGPYIIDSIDFATQVVLAENEKYNGDEKLDFSRVVIRSVSESATQKLNLEGGDSHVAVDLSGDQVADLADGVSVTSGPSAQTIFLLLNQNPEISKITSNPDFVDAVRYALDYEGLLELAGAGSEQATGVIPPAFLGALDSGVERDLGKSAKSLTASGYNDETITLEYPNDYPVGGVSFTPLAERIQAQLDEAGIKLKLAPAPFTTQIDEYVNGREAFSIWFWAPDYADSANFLPFAAGDKVGLRAGWNDGMSPESVKLASAAANATTVDEREIAFRKFTEEMQKSGPFVPLIVPGSNIATAESITGVAYNSTWTMDIAELHSK
ncbi:ABC transporter substrate-binding protein [Paeniglutamicibacter gangotriensis]|uniref:Family 5 extracellular solute-binding protein n=1 Tax=Paeniglutamicibacter gangotriensis Lz1y TaxID=1276920 RepID=M7MKD5_9MICC|nr:ABC transporter substrate-binding protein [Paeniglutamicibacter gangotriensis]EMQ96757.1 family 5 extracellular solute-binding protein [Paeniglutamicibacter gangotriensis Lz1y]